MKIVFYSMSALDNTLPQLFIEKFPGRILPIGGSEVREGTFGAMVPDEFRVSTESFYVELARPVTDEEIEKALFACFKESGWTDYTLDDDPVYRRGSVCIEGVYFDVTVFYDDKKTSIEGRKVLCVNIFMPVT